MKLLLLILFISFLFISPARSLAQEQHPWEIRSIDTMKYSRDLSREMLNNSSSEAVIDQQMKAIAATGATHVAIATPYDQEFLPVLQRWVSAARKYNLSVWYRGNWSGWEGWFDYPDIDRKTHLIKTGDFILSNPELFRDGDIFTSCPECENGGPGDPRMTGDVAGHRAFLIEEYKLMNQNFQKINKQVITNFFSMNGDVARLVMDKSTTKALGGVVVIDHYVRSSDQLITDIRDIARNSGGKVVLGEIGAPIPDIHGQMSEKEQNQWLLETFGKLTWEDDVVGINYWVDRGGSTKLWEDNGDPRLAASTIERFYKNTVFKGSVVNEAGEALENVRVSINDYTTITDNRGVFYLPYVPKGENIVIESDLYTTLEKKHTSDLQTTTIALTQEDETLRYKILKFLRKLFPPLSW